MCKSWLLKTSFRCGEAVPSSSMDLETSDEIIKIDDLIKLTGVEFDYKTLENKMELNKAGGTHDNVSAQSLELISAEQKFCVDSNDTNINNNTLDSLGTDQVYEYIKRKIGILEQKFNKINNNDSDPVNIEEKFDDFTYKNRYHNLKAHSPNHNLIFGAKVFAHVSNPQKINPISRESLTISEDLGARRERVVKFDDKLYISDFSENNKCLSSPSPKSAFSSAIKSILKVKSVEIDENRVPATSDLTSSDTSTEIINQTNRVSHFRKSRIKNIN